MEISTKPRPRVADHRYLIGDGVVLLDDGEHVQSEPAAQDDLQLGQVFESSKQLWRDEGVRAQKQEGIAGIVIVVVRRGVIAATPRGGAANFLRLYLTPHCVCAAVACRDCAALPQRRWKNSGAPAGQRPLVDKQRRRDAWAGRRRELSWWRLQTLRSASRRDGELERW